MAQAGPVEPAFLEVGDNPKLPRVLLIGDSISIGYTLPVRDLLKQRANVHRPATNCQGTQQGLIALDKWLGQERWDVIHFNFGIHDIKYVGPRGELQTPQYGQQVTSPEQYEINLRSLVTRLKLTKAKLIWGSTTPIVSRTLGFVLGDEVKYNAIAAKVMKENGVIIDDLHATALPRLADIQLPTNVHFTPAGYEFLGEAVAHSILAVLPPPPTIAGLSKTSGPVASSVAINGDNLADATSVTFNGVEAAEFTVLSAKQILATVPALATNGRISVSTHGGTATSGNSFRITPAITSFTPDSGPVGTPVEIAGTTLTGTMALGFSSAPAPVTYQSANRVRTRVPPDATSGAIHLQTPNGAVTSFGSFRVTPQIGRFTPSRGTGGTVVTISGSGLSGIKSIEFNGAASAFQPLSPTAAQATVPAGATSGRLRVTTEGGVTTSATPFFVTPKMDSFAPAAGFIGSAVTINGTTLSEVTTVTFNGTQARFNRLSPTQLQATVPPNATSGRISIIGPTGSATSTSNFTVLPQLLKFTPTRARVGATIIIIGTGFNGVRMVSIGGQVARYTVISPTRIDAVVPAKVTTGPIRVVTTVGLSSSTEVFTLAPTPTKRSEATDQAPTPPAAATNPRPEISMITPDLPSSSIRLSFFHTPSAEQVNDRDLYLVSIDGVTVDIESVSYIAGIVTLGVPQDSLKEGAQVIVQWR